MVEPTNQSFSTVFFPNPCDSTWRTWNPHPNPVSSPPTTINLDSTTINTTNSHTKNPKECTGNPQPNPTSPKKNNNNTKLKKKKKKKKKKRSQKMELRPTCLTISRSTCLMIWPRLSLTSFLESPIIGKASDLMVRMSHDLAWAQFDIVSRIPCRRQSFWSLVLLSLSLMPHKKGNESSRLVRRESFI